MDKSKFNNKKEIKKFGIGLALIFSLVALVRFFFGKDTDYYLISAALLVLSLALISPLVLKPIFVAFSYLAFGLGWLNTRIILSLIFYIIFVPIGFTMKIFGKDALGLKLDKAKKSYWRKSKTAGLSNYENQF